ncbi:14318_t:CDS:2 [Cetraspora pellucida]|uniref:14318_t:CDS:1 n=1 Tax=Cetraspora pellucida TaxID=1433469 RepID=A0ACA9KHF6_9GLOM|nr:14318_t:CDS:2 [Cetraspora pellucida]
MPEIITPQKRINQIIENIPLVANKRFNFKSIKENIKIFHADCLLALDKMESNSQRKEKAKVIGGLPVGMKFDPQQGKRLQEFMSVVAQKLLRVLKPGGFFLCFSQGRLYHRTVVAIEEAGFEIRDMII